jgi:2-hydroxychromene-2-carboxylate isomerase
MSSEKTKNSRDTSNQDLPRVMPSKGYQVPLPQNWCADHFDDDLHPPIKPLPVPLTGVVNESNPLEFDLFWSMRSPYCYLVLGRILALNANYNVRVNVRPLAPIAIQAGGFPGAFWYRWNYDMIDSHRVAKFLGVPFRRPPPEPLEQNTFPPYTCDLKIDTDPAKHPNIYRVTRCAIAAQLQGNGLEFLNHVSHMMWDGQTDDWPNHLVETMDRAGMDGKAVDADVAANPDKYDAIIAENMAVHTACGHGGVPLMAFRQEPFFGQDRFDLLFWTLQRSGLTKRDGDEAL